MSDSPTPELELDPSDAVLDIQHDTDPADDHGPARRIPHMGHALLFFALTAFCVFGCAAVLFSFAKDAEEVSLHPLLSLFTFAIAYVLALAVSWRLFPHFWGRSFLHGIQWNVLGARRRWFWVIPCGVVLSLLAQYSERFVQMPKDDIIAKLMQTQRGAWIVTAFGVLLAPLMEEIAFRGFLLPALATAYDWLALDRTPAALRKWEMTSGHSKSSLVFGTVFSSFFFALIHSGQLSHAWGAVGIIFAVGLVLSYVRIRTYSVACSTMMHCCYNLTIFASVFITTGGYQHMDKL